jgi:hydroxymethylglutaryl-CoA synthase
LEDTSGRSKQKQIKNSIDFKGVANLDMGIGITAYGVYLPRYRVYRKEIGEAWGATGRGELTIGNEDEDVITMAIEAANNALASAGMSNGSSLDAFYLATSSSPYVEGSSAMHLKMALRGKPTADAVDFNSTARGGTLALKASLDALKSGRIKNVVLVTGDMHKVSPGSNLEKTLGAGAAAIVLGTDNPIAEIESTYSYSTFILDYWRADGQIYPQDYEPKFTRRWGYEHHVVEATKGLLKQTCSTAADYDYVVLQTSDVRGALAAAKTLGVSRDKLVLSPVTDSIGEIGNASVFLGLIEVLEQAQVNDRVLVVSYGFGGSDAFSIRVKRDHKLPENLSLKHYLDSKILLNYVGFLQKTKTLAQADIGIKSIVSPASPLIWRDQEAFFSHLGAKCKACGYVNYPPSQRHLCIKCGHQELELVEISRKGRVHTCSLNYKLPPPLESPLPIIVVDLEDGVRHRALGTEMSGDELTIDMEVELILRLITVENGARLYGYKFRRPR